MIEIKVSQGAKPGHGGILPAAKVTAEIAATRLVPEGQDVFSPTYHKAFSTPLEMCAFIAQLRELSGGKPVGFKICIGDPREFMAHRQGDDGERDLRRLHRRRRWRGRDRSGAAGVLQLHGLHRWLEGLLLVQNALVGAGIRDQFKIGASGKMVTASAMARSMAHRRRLVQLRAGVHVRGRLHPGAAMPHQPVPRRRDDPGPEAPAGPRRPGQGRARAQLPQEHRARAGRDDRRDGAGPHERAASAPRHSAGSPSSRPSPSTRSTPIVEPGELLEGKAPPRFQRMWDEGSAESFHTQPAPGPAAPTPAPVG